jgi:hypothetical protein
MDGAGPDRAPARLPASSAMLRAHVTTVISAFSGKCLAISIVVDPESRRIVSPGRIVAPATRPIRRFASAWLIRAEVEGSIRPRLGLRYRHRSAGSALAPRARRGCHWSQSGTDATRSGYTVGYFEGLGVGSLLAVADAAEATRSPVILGFSGVSLPHPAREVRDRLYAAEAWLTGNFAIPAARLAEIETAGSGPDSGVGSGLRRQTPPLPRPELGRRVHECVVIRRFDRKAKRCHILKGAAKQSMEFLIAGLNFLQPSILTQLSAFEGAVAVRSLRFPVTTPL